MQEHVFCKNPIGNPAEVSMGKSFSHGSLQKGSKSFVGLCGSLLVFKTEDYDWTL